MALFLGREGDTIKVISSKDSSVRCSDDDYQDYLESLDEELLNLNPGVEPTRFVLKKVLNERERQILNAKKVKKDKRGKPQVNADFIVDEMHMCIKDIEEDAALPEGSKLTFHKDVDGRVDKPFLNFLDQAGILIELHTARENSFRTSGGPLKKS